METCQIRAKLAIRKNFKRFIRSDSKAVVKRRFALAGDAFIELTKTEGKGVELTAKGPSLQAEADQELVQIAQDFLEKLKENTLPTLTKIPTMVTEYTRLAEDFNDPKGDFRLLLADVRKLTGGIDRGEGLLGRIMRDKEMAGKMGAILNKLESFVGKLDRMADGMKPNVEGLSPKMKKLEDILVAMQEILKTFKGTSIDLASISATVKQEMKDLPGLLLKVHGMLGQVERLIIALQRHWLIRSYVPPAEKGGKIPLKRIKVKGGE